MDAKRELQKIVKTADSLGISKQDLAEKAGLHRYYIATSMTALSKDPMSNLRKSSMKKLKAAIDAEVVKRNGGNGVAQPVMTKPSPVLAQDKTTNEQAMDLLDLLEMKHRRTGVSIRDISVKLGFCKEYITKTKRRMNRQNRIMRAGTLDNLRLHLMEMDKVAEEEGRVEVVVNENQLSLPFEQSFVPGTCIFDDAEVQTLKAPPEAEPKKDTAADVLRGLIVDRLQNMSTVQLALLLGRLAGEDGQ